LIAKASTAPSLYPQCSASFSANRTSSSPLIRGKSSWTAANPTTATIEPTAIAFALPVDTSLGEADIAGLQRRLEAPVLHGSLVLVAWEHTEIVALARSLMTAHGGKPDSIPRWHGHDFDSIDVLRITWTGTSSSIQFVSQHENLNSQPTTCPGSPPG
jgi:hypothetical protein